jgi:hypothetical protein
MIMPRTVLGIVPLLLASIIASCEPDTGPVLVDEAAVEQASAETDRDREVDLILRSNLDRLSAHADSIETALRPVPLLTSSQIQAFTRFRNADQLVAARRLGVAQPLSETAIERHLQEGRLIDLDEENEFWVIRELDHSVPLATPDVRELLHEIGRRFHDRLADHALPPLRLEVTSVLRTAANQAELRRVNPNAARSESTHQFGTTVDIAYSSFRAPREPVVDLDLRNARWLEEHLRRVEAMAAETGAARMSRELQAILGHVLREMQTEGLVMVTLEVRQPVYHMTVARRLTD